MNLNFRLYFASAVDALLLPLFFAISLSNRLLFFVLAGRDFFIPAHSIELKSEGNVCKNK
jgi:hypothetical protein